ncbi:MAG: hypothetical protein WDM96_14280 [Lacunisphaera sp.]
MNSWPRPYTAVARLRRGAPVIIPGDGTSLWTLTHNVDFAKALAGAVRPPGRHRPALPHHLGRGAQLEPDS